MSAPVEERPEPVGDAGRYKWTIVALLWFICFFNYADRQAIFAVFSLLEKDFRFNPEQLGAIGSAFAIVYAVTAPIAGPFADRFSRKWVIIAGLYVWSLVTGFTALCSQVWHFVLVRGAEGLGETFYFPASMSMVSDYHAKETRSRAMSLHQTSVYAGTIGGSTFAGWMGMHYGWQWPFVILGVAGIVLGLVLTLFIREPRRNQAELAAAGAPFKPIEQIPMKAFLGELARTPTAMMLVAAFFGANSVAAVFLVWMPKFLKDKFALNLAEAGFNATVYIQLASLVGAVLGGMAADRWRSRRPGGRILTQAVGALAGAPFIFLCGWTREFIYVAVAMTLFGLSKGVYDANIWASLYDVIPPSRRGAAVGLMNFLGWSGFSIATIAIGAAVSRGVTMSAAISSTAVIYLVVCGLLVVAGLVFAPRDVERVNPTA
jgi:MFS family permease